MIENYNNDDNKLIKKFQDKIDQYRIINDTNKKTIDQINAELYKNKFEIII